MMNGNTGLGMNMGYGMGMQQPQTQMSATEQQPQHQEPQLSQADFDAAFEEAMVEMEKMQDERMTGTQPETMDQAPSLEKSDIRIGSDTIDYTEQANRTPDQDQRDADELARTAGHLLNLVQHDTSDKFQNSQFLDLMRKIRDREIAVQDNDLHSTTTKPPPTTSAAGSQITAEPPSSSGATDLRPHDPNAFSFPDLNPIYEPLPADLAADQAATASYYEAPAGSWQQTPTPQQPMQAPPPTSDADAMYSAASAEYPVAYYPPTSSASSTSYYDSPQSQLHPGGPYYPEMSPRMSGARRFSVGRAMGEGRGGAVEEEGRRA